MDRTEWCIMGDGVGKVKFGLCGSRVLGIDAKRVEMAGGEGSVTV